MKLVVFSDIHGNSDVLKKMLAEEPPSKNCQYICCGDIVGYYYNVKECINMLREIENLICVRGNHDQMYINAFFDASLTSTLVRKYGSSYKYRDISVIEYLSTLPLQKTLQIDEKNILIQHGTPDDLLEGRIYPDTEIYSNTDKVVDIILSGHTHYRMHKMVNQTHWINPGSLGQPRDGMGFSYCVIITKPFLVEFRKLEVNMDKLKKQIQMYDIHNSYLREILERKKEET